MERPIPKFHLFRAPEGAVRVPLVRDWEHYPLRVFIEGGGKVRTAFIGSWQSHGALLVREDVLEVINRAGLTGHKTRPVEIAKVKSKILRQIEPPPYYEFTATDSIETTSRCYKYLGDGRYACEPDQETARRQRRGSIRQIPDEASWDGSDFFHAKIKGSFGQVLCTFRFVELARRDGWDNLSFAPLDSLHARCYKDFRKLPWPPSEWFPPGHPE